MPFKLYLLGRARIPLASTYISATFLHSSQSTLAVHGAFLDGTFTLTPLRKLIDSSLLSDSSHLLFLPAEASSLLSPSSNPTALFPLSHSRTGRCSSSDNTKATKSASSVNECSLPVSGAALGFRFEYLLSVSFRDEEFTCDLRVTFEGPASGCELATPEPGDRSGKRSGEGWRDVFLFFDLGLDI